MSCHELACSVRRTGRHPQDRQLGMLVSRNVHGRGIIKVGTPGRHAGEICLEHIVASKVVDAIGTNVGTTARASCGACRDSYVRTDGLTNHGFYYSSYAHTHGIADWTTTLTPTRKCGLTALPTTAGPMTAKDVDERTFVRISHAQTQDPNVDVSAR